jgi:hypothetical protein
VQHEAEFKLDATPMISTYKNFIALFAPNFLAVCFFIVEFGAIQNVSALPIMFSVAVILAYILVQTEAMLYLLFASQTWRKAEE